MKLLFTTLILSCALAVHAQTNPAGINGSGANSNGNAYSNGNVPDPNEQTQNRPDSTLRSSDTTYQHQQWNDGSAQQPARKTNKRSTSTATTAKKKK